MTGEQLGGYRTLPHTVAAFSPTAEVIPITSQFILKPYIPVIWPLQSSILPVEAGTIEGGFGNVPKLVNCGHI